MGASSVEPANFCGRQFMLADDLAVRPALRLRKQVVVPIAVRVRAKVRELSGFAHHTHVGARACPLLDGKERLQPGLDALDRRLARETPLSIHVPDVCVMCSCRLSRFGLLMQVTWNSFMMRLHRDGRPFSKAVRPGSKAQRTRYTS